jgi:alkylation response protein AidB-like acyl-CoA dehydrogenase
MTFAAVPSLRTTPSLAALWEPKITALSYDPRNVPDAQKAGLTIGMAMTEKQGGSDVRANSTRAYPVGAGGQARPMSWWATSTLFRRRCAMPSWCSRRRRAA